ncbi:signal peptidase complex subunit SPC1 [Sporobolomyces koalae]|uniref:signal peptidase complex subunit SPC1 n=1 Tax=Sporobolomyces koalae TaxID=500713 RepID=UPI00317CCB62
MQALERQVDVVRDKLEGPIDFVGQDLAEQYQRQILWASGALAFVIGFALQSMRALLIVFAAGFLVCLAVTGPSYSTYTRNPIRWLPNLDRYGTSNSESSSSSGTPETATAIDDRKDR